MEEECDRGANESIQGGREMRRQEISNGDDIIDSRDVIKRLGELEDDLGALMYDLEKAEGKHEKEKAQEALDEWNEENLKELEALRSLVEQAEGYGDWEFGETLIHDSFFTDYARELAEDIGALKDNSGWPSNCIDWDQAAEELQQDYMDGGLRRCDLLDQGIREG